MWPGPQSLHLHIPGPGDDQAEDFPGRHLQEADLLLRAALGSERGGGADTQAAPDSGVCWRCAGFDGSGPRKVAQCLHESELAGALQKKPEFVLPCHKELLQHFAISISILQNAELLLCLA